MDLSFSEPGAGDLAKHSHDIVFWPNQLRLRTVEYQSTNVFVPTPGLTLNSQVVPQDCCLLGFTTRRR